MGQDAQAYLCYGYYLGGEEFGWNVTNEEAIRNIEELGGDNFREGVEYIFLKDLSGFTRVDSGTRPSDYYLKLNEAELRLEVELVQGSSYEYPCYVLAVKPVHWAYDWTPIEVDIAVDHAATMKLDKALKALGITPTQPEPKWILVPFYG